MRMLLVSKPSKDKAAGDRFRDLSNLVADSSALISTSSGNESVPLSVQPVAVKQRREPLRRGTTSILPLQRAHLETRGLEPLTFRMQTGRSTS
jgi:hypothetical protein